MYLAAAEPSPRPAPDPLAISCPRCSVPIGEDCQREERYAGLPHHQRVSAVGGDTMALSLEENLRYRESSTIQRRGRR